MVAVVVMFSMMMTAHLIMLRHGSQAMQLEKANRDLLQGQKISKVKTDVERAVFTTLKKVETNLSDPQSFYRITNQLVRLSPHIVGAGVAFRPGYYAKMDKPRLYAPYAYDEKPSIKAKKHKSNAPNIVTRLLSFDYMQRDWFTHPITDGKSYWSDPYMDMGGTQIVTCTFATPVRDADGSIVAILFADVPMEEAVMLTDDHEEDFTRDVWMLLGLMLLCMIVLCIIFWRAVKASMKFRKDNYDVDREQLVSEVEKLKTVNRRLTERNVELSKMVQRLQQTTDQHYFG